MMRSALFMRSIVKVNCYVNVLFWWENNQAHNLTLAKTACDVLNQIKLRADGELYLRRQEPDHRQSSIFIQ